MIQADIASISPADLRTYKLGSILAGGNAAPGNNVRTTPQAWLDLTDAFYRRLAWPRRARRIAPIPILFGIDAVHGHAKVVGATIFPHNVGSRRRARSGPDPAHRPGNGGGSRRAPASTGPSHRPSPWRAMFAGAAPTKATPNRRHWWREYAAAMVTGLQGRRGTPQFMAPGHTLSSVKHFLGDGGTLGRARSGRHRGAGSRAARRARAGYPAAIKAGALIVMASYNSWNGVKLHANHYLLTDILKGRLGFDGFVVGDWNAHEQIPGCTKYRLRGRHTRRRRHVDGAGQLAGTVQEHLGAKRARARFRRRASTMRCARILRVKAIAGLFERPAPKQRSDAGDFAQLGQRGASRARRARPCANPWCCSRTIMARCP